MQEPIVIDITQPPPNPAQEVVDILVGSFGLAGLAFVVASALGLLLAVFLYWRTLHADDPLTLTHDHQAEDSQ